jgi:hypothetical protein
MSEAAQPDERIERRITEIESWMAAKKGSPDYKRYYDSPKVQAEYRELLSERQKRFPWLTTPQTS